MHFMDDGGWFLGMHLFWWLLWMIILSSFFWMVIPVSRKRAREMRGLGGTVQETPLTVLQHRYAAGEITTQQYEDQKSRLQQSASQVDQGGLHNHGDS